MKVRETSSFCASHCFSSAWLSSLKLRNIPFWTLLLPWLPLNDCRPCRLGADCLFPISGLWQMAYYGQLQRSWMKLVSHKHSICPSFSTQYASAKRFLWLPLDMSFSYSIWEQVAYRMMDCGVLTEGFVWAILTKYDVGSFVKRIVSYWSVFELSCTSTDRLLIRLTTITVFVV